MADNTVQQLGFTGTVKGKINISTLAAQGRYLRLWMEQDNEYMQIGEVEVYNLPPNGEEPPFVSQNVALNKPTTSSGTKVFRAVDGDRTLVSINPLQENPWLEVDFESPKRIDNIQIFPNGTKYQRISNVHVLLSNKPFTHASLSDALADGEVQQLGFTGTVVDFANIDIDGVEGRYLRLWMEDTEYLQIGEVEVYDAPPAP